MTNINGSVSSGLFSFKILVENSSKSETSDIDQRLIAALLSPRD